MSSTKRLRVRAPRYFLYSSDRAEVGRAVVGTSNVLQHVFVNVLTRLQFEPLVLPYNVAWLVVPAESLYCLALKDGARFRIR